MIKLVKSSFHRENVTKKKLVEFILQAETLSMGEQCQQFELAFSKKQQRKYSVFVNSGSSANLVLIQALLNIDLIKKGDRVGVSALTWSTNIMPLIQLGLEPVVIDCALNTLNVSPEILQKSADNLKALFLTNVLGFSDQIHIIKNICQEKKIIFIEDNCEALGSIVQKQLLGNFGLASTFSFFVGHHLSTIEGGMICTDDKELFQMLKIVRAHGWDRDLPALEKEKLRKKHQVKDFFAKYSFYDLAYNARPTEINGFLGNIQINYWDEIVIKRFNNFKQFHQIISQNNELLPIEINQMDLVSNFAIPVLCKNKELFNKYQDRFTKNEVEIRPIIAGNITNQPFYKKYLNRDYFCQNASFIENHGFYFGNNSDLNQKEINLLCQLLNK